VQYLVLFLFLISLTGILFISIRIIRRHYDKKFEKIQACHLQVVELEEKHRFLQEKKKNKEEDVQDTIDLYGITKDISKFLDINKIFSNFKTGLNKIISFDECVYLEKIGPHDNFDDFLVIPLSVDKTMFGYLAIKGLKKEEKMKLDIPVAQLISALKRAKLYGIVQRLSITDSLTKTFTHTYVLDRLKEEIGRSAQFDLSLCCLMIDIDNFKIFNDKYGHLVGDVILKEVSRIIKSNCREIDLIGRFGGEEFLVVLPMTPKDNGIFVAERIRQSVAEASIKAFDENIHITISIGVACFSEDSKSCQELIDKADWALYRSKQTGKNKVTSYAKFH